MKLIRSAGFNEHRCIARDSLSLYGSIVTLATYHDPSSNAEAISQDMLFKILKACVTRHPVLGLVVQDSATEKPWLARPASLNLKDHLQTLDTVMSNQDSFQATLETVHNVPVTDYEKKPQWKAYIAYEGHSTFHLAFACSHALADGRSGLFFHGTFLDALTGINDLPYDSSPVLSLASNGKILPPLELAGNLAISWSYLLGPLLNEYMPAWLVRAIGMQPKTADPDNSDILWTGTSKRPEKVATELPTTLVETVELPYDIVQKALMACKSHHARLTGLLLHLAARSLARALQLQGEDSKKFKISTAIDLRKCIPEGRDEMGVLVSSVDETVSVDSTRAVSRDLFSEEDWDSVRSTTRRLETASSTLSDQPVGLLKYLNNYKDWTSRKAQAAANTSFEVSNLGRFEGNKSQSSTWAVERMSFSQSADATGSPFSLNVASVDNGPLLIALSWWPGMLGVGDERRLAKDICTGIVSQLHAISSN